ncbi:hypothetical protein B0J11DRAFT_56634 [Dendryphion nanum]|uniref:Rhodopsin domain-containing protein n=1 Tax=Dendryphion nanum TaxID=256645 RepID=A0A9P9IIU4_9PLEO|nr:hypothetical protein B0J11DRAFT_56634 [Dendryphion nanum]
MAETNGPKIVISLWVQTIIPFFFMILRYYCKVRYTKVFGWDDWLLALSWIFVLIYTTLIHVSVNYDVGKHFHEADSVQLVTGIKFMYLGELFALLAMPTSKTSFCITLLRLTEIYWHKWIIWFIIVSVNITMWLCAALTFGQCSPVEKLWNYTLEGECWDNRIVIYYSIVVGAYACVLDVLLAICPWLIIHKLQMNKREKFGVIFAMSLGCLAAVACAIKTSYIPQIGTWKDFTFNIAEVLIWGLAESAITIMAASIPFMRLLIREVSSRSGSNGRSNKKSSANTYQLQDRSHHSNLGNKTKAETDIYHKQLAGKDDEGSDKSILGEARGYQGKIMQTSEVRIEYGDGGDDFSVRNDKSGQSFYH